MADVMQPKLIDGLIVGCYILDLYISRIIYYIGHIMLGKETVNTNSLPVLVRSLKSSSVELG